MPVCLRCKKTQPTAEVRRTQKGWVCKDKVHLQKKRGGSVPQSDPPLDQLP
jgi:hypothetical protein